MKKNFILLICAILLSACSVDVNQLLGIPPTPTLAPPPTITNTPADTPTITLTVPTPTFTLTPTLIGVKTKTFTPEATSTVLLYTPTPLAATSDLLFTPQAPMQGFVNISISSDTFYKRKKCSPNSVKFIVQVAEPEKVSFVVLFVRFKSKLTNSTSKWTSITMDKQTLGAGTFLHELKPEEMKAVDSFENAWVEYQLVSTDINSKQVGKTGIFSEKLLLPECSPDDTPTPTVAPTVGTPATVTPTATAKK